jgi:hypothetical protein
MHPEGGSAAQWEWAPLLLLLLISLAKRMSQARAFSRIALQRIRPLIVDIGDSTPRSRSLGDAMRCDARAMPATASLPTPRLGPGGVQNATVRVVKYHLPSLHVFMYSDLVVHSMIDYA